MKRARPPHPSGSTDPAHPFDPLTGLRQQLRIHAIAQAKARAQAIEAERARESDRRSMQEAFADVTPLPATTRVAVPRAPRATSLPPPSPPPAPAPAALSDDDRFANMGADGEPLRWHAPGHSAKLPQRLYRGTWPLEAHLDLHGQTVDQARGAVFEFIRQSQSQGMRCLRIVHGKGAGSAHQIPVLKTLVPGWLTQIPCIIAFCHAPPQKGGHGATLVLLAAPT